MEKGELRSNIKKLWRHLQYILNIENEPRPICLVLHLTSKCNLDCDFCYIKNRDRTHELDYDKLINFISVIKPKSVQLTGGEPTLYPKIDELIYFLYANNCKIGMFTNGKELWRCKFFGFLNWLRISINYYIDNDKEFVDPSNPKKLGYVYIKHENSPDGWEERINKFADSHSGSYLKVAPDINYLTTINPWLFRSFKVIIQKTHSTKYYKGKCYMGFLKPYLNADGLVYPCINTVDPKTRIRDKSKAITTIDRPQDLLNFDVPYKEMNCKNCGLWDRNEFIKYIKKRRIEDEDFL